jgi:hypothetical protein
MDIIHDSQEFFQGRKALPGTGKGADPPSFRTSRFLEPTSPLKVHTSTQAASKYTREKKLNNYMNVNINDLNKNNIIKDENSLKITMTLIQSKKYSTRYKRITLKIKGDNYLRGPVDFSPMGN